MAASDGVFDFCDKILDTYEGALDAVFLLACKDLKFETPSPLFFDEGARFGANSSLNLFSPALLSELF